MRYWGFFAAKVTVVVATAWGLLQLLNWAWPPSAPSVRFKDYIPPLFGYNLWFTLAVLMWFLIGLGGLYLTWWDQRYRCRVCLRRLRMPVETGSWSRMLQFGSPRIEYICPYGHGTLKEDEFQISGVGNPEWTPNSDDIWEELYATSKESEEKS